MLKFAIAADYPVAIRYPRGNACDLWKEQRASIVRGKSEILCEGEDVALFAIGTMVEIAWNVKEKLSNRGISATVINARFMAPLDEEAILSAAEKYPLIVTMEENIASGGFGEHIAALLEREGAKAGLLTIAIENRYVEHGDVETLRKVPGIDADTIFGMRLLTGSSKSPKISSTETLYSFAILISASILGELFPVS